MTKTKKDSEAYRLPSTSLLDDKLDEVFTSDEAFIREQILSVEKILESFNACAYISNVVIGSSVTQFEISLNPGVRIDKITKIQPEICMAMKEQRIRICAPIPGKDAVGIEVPNKASGTVYLRQMLESSTWRKSNASIPILLGRDLTSRITLFDLAKAPHLLIAGCTGSGKSVCLNSIIMSLLFRFSSDELKFVMLDPERAEQEMYCSIPHLITPVVDDPKNVLPALRGGVDEMERRFNVLRKVKARNLAKFNSRLPDSQPVLDDEGNAIPQKLPIMVIVINELADIMMPKSREREEVETIICRIAQKGHIVGVHLIVATQSPRKEVITSFIKANIPTRIALRVNDAKESRVILDAAGAERLLGNGDMLFNPPGGAALERIQGVYVSDDEVDKVIDAVCKQSEERL